MKYKGQELLKLDFDTLNELNVEGKLDYLPEEFENEGTEIEEQIIDFLSELSEIKIDSFDDAKRAVSIIEEKYMEDISKVVSKYIYKLKDANKSLKNKTHYRLVLKDMINDNWNYKIIKDITF